MKPVSQYTDLLATLEALVEHSPNAKSIMADTVPSLELAATTVILRQASYHLDGIETEINLTTPEACPPYEWRAEVTVRSTPLQHFLLTTNGEIVSAYGKHVEALSTYDTQGLAQHLAQLA